MPTAYQAFINASCLNGSSDQVTTTATCILGVSVGGQAHAGEKLKATIKLINEKFSGGKCIIAVCDTLQRHNWLSSSNIREDKALELAEQEGTQWITKNKPIIETLTVPYEIHRWEEWRCTEIFLQYIKEVTDHYQENHQFHEAIEKSIELYISRFKSRAEALRLYVIEDKLHDACRAYLLEECAIIMKMWPELSKDTDQYVLYPGNMTAALEVAYEAYVLPKLLSKNDNHHNFEWLKIQFKNVRSLANNSENRIAKMLKTTLIEPLSRFSMFSSGLQPCELCPGDKMAYLAMLAIVNAQIPNDEKASLLTKYATMISEQDDEFLHSAKFHGVKEIEDNTSSISCTHA